MFFFIKGLFLSIQLTDTSALVQVMAWRSANKEIHAYMGHLDSIMVNLRGITSFLSSFVDITKNNFWEENRRLCDPICLGEMRDTAHFQSCKSKEIWRYLVDHFGKKVSSMSTKT